MKLSIEYFSLLVQLFYFICYYACSFAVLGTSILLRITNNLTYNMEAWNCKMMTVDRVSECVGFNVPLDT